MNQLGKTTFISYRGNYYLAAEAVGHWLVERGYCKSSIVFTPGELSEKDEALLPYEYVELMEFILDRLARTESFVIINTNDYLDSYFTQAEVLQWRRFKDRPSVYMVGIDDRGQFTLSEPVALEPLAKNQKKLWASISVGIARSYKHHMNPGFAAGKYAKSCFLLPCHTCGEHFLISRKAVYRALTGEFTVSCPHCGNSQFQFRELAQRGNYYRKPLIIEQPHRVAIRVLEDSEILALLVNNELPSRIPLVSLEGEKFSSDIATLGKFYLTLGALAAGVMGLLALLNSDSGEE